MVGLPCYPPAEAIAPAPPKPPDRAAPTPPVGVARAPLAPAPSAGAVTPVLATDVGEDITAGGDDDDPIQFHAHGRHHDTALAPPPDRGGSLHASVASTQAVCCAREIPPVNVRGMAVIRTRVIFLDRFMIACSMRR